MGNKPSSISSASSRAREPYQQPSTTYIHQPPVAPNYNVQPSYPQSQPPYPQPQMGRADPGGLTLKFQHKYGFIPDSFSSLEQVQKALRDAGLESSNLIVGVDFTKSNEWTGKHTFGGRNLHAIGQVQNPYEKAITVIGKTLESFDEDKLIPCYGFGDASTHDQSAFSFNKNQRPCNGFQECLQRYRQIVPHVRLAGPTSFAPVIEAAVRIVEESGGQYHVLLIIADGQVTRSSDLPPGQLSPQEKATVDAIVAASKYPLSIILVGVGDGPWDTMRAFDDILVGRDFDNFQFVDFSDIMARNLSETHKEAQFAVSALMEIPFQYKACVELGHIGCRKGMIPPRKPMEPPPSVLEADSKNTPSTPSAFGFNSDANSCPICFTNNKNMAFQCGHQTCTDCGNALSHCPICRTPIATRIRLYG